MRIHRMEISEGANGPGRRLVYWVQGCSLRCPGCANVEMWPPDHPNAYDEEPFFLTMEANDLQHKLEGITITGGEPFEQPRDELYDLVWYAQQIKLSVVVFTGYTWAELHISSNPNSYTRKLLDDIDVLIAGPYRQDLPKGQPMCASANQRVHLLTDRYTDHDIAACVGAELIMNADGTFTVTGTDRLITDIKGTLE